MFRRYSRLKQKELLSKARLWTVLHGLKMEQAIVQTCSLGKCPNHQAESGCKLKKWEHRLQTNRDMTKAGYACLTDKKYVFCIEWAKYV